MKKLITLTFIFAFFFTVANGQEVRTYDGSNNNLANPTWGAIHTQLNRIAAPAYACLLYTSPSPRDRTRSRMPSSA